MEMPKSIKLFEQLYLGSLVLGVIQGALMQNSMDAMPNPAGVSEAEIIGFQIIIMIIIGSLVLLTSRKKSVVCKWIITIFFVAGMFAAIPGLAISMQQGVMGLISVIQLLMQAWGTYLLFNSDSKDWFASKKLADG